MMGGVVVAVLVVPLTARVWIVPALILVAISLLDDWRGLPASLRFSAHLIVSFWMCSELIPHEDWATRSIVAFAMVWITNLFNFMDGADGLAGGMTLWGFGSLGVAAWFAGDAVLAWSNFVVASVSLPFLLFNFHPARIFMGDAGSIPIGFLASTFGLIGWHGGVWSICFPVLVFSPFIVDATVTLVRRIVRGQRFWEAHKGHYYQRLVLLGWSHRRLAIAEYVLMAGVGASAVCAQIWRPSSFNVVVAVWIVIYLALLWAVDRRWADTASVRRQ